MRRPFDSAAALDYLSTSRSAFIQAAATWLVDFDDPADVLIALSGPVSQSLGPWETYRFASLLGLFHSGAVAALGQDVLAEPVSERAFPPPLAPAFAIAHASAHFPQNDAPYVDSVRAALAAAAERDATSAVLSAQLALGIKDNATVSALLRIASGDAPGGEEVAQSLAQPIWEAAVLSGRKTLAATAAALTLRGQQDDGGLTAPSPQRMVRALYTLRAVCLLRRADAGFN